MACAQPSWVLGTITVHRIITATVCDSDRNIAPGAKWSLNNFIFWIKAKKKKSPTKAKKPKNSPKLFSWVIILSFLFRWENCNSETRSESKRVLFFVLCKLQKYASNVSFHYCVTEYAHFLKASASGSAYNIIAIQYLFADWMTHWPLGKRGWWYRNWIVISQENRWGFPRTYTIHCAGWVSNTV